LLAGDGAENSDGEAGSREWVAVYEVSGDREEAAEGTDLVLE